MYQWASMAQSESHSSSFHSHLCSTYVQQPPLNFNLSTCWCGLKFVAWSVVGLVGHENGLNFFVFFWGGGVYSYNIYVHCCIYHHRNTWKLWNNTGNHHNDADRLKVGWWHTDYGWSGLSDMPETCKYFRPPITQHRHPSPLLTSCQYQ